MRPRCKSPLVWAGLYKQDYDLATPESTAHPAKAAWGLVFKILEHLEELGLLAKDSTVLDMMCGTARIPIAACAKGYRATGVELESRFVEFSKANREYASRKLGRELDLTIIQGDSRHLSDLLQQRGLVSITSPPYSDITVKDGQRLASNPDVHWKDWDRGTGYSDNPANVGNLPDKPLVALTSPPYGETGISGGDLEKRLVRLGAAGYTEIVRQYREGNPKARNFVLKDYGTSPGQVGALPDKPLTAITSPPYEDSVVRQGDKAFHTIGLGEPTKYGASKGQVGNEKQESYLEAMRAIYSETIRVASVLCVIVKNPTRNKQLRRLDLDTIRILEECGWVIHCRHEARLFEEQETHDLFGETKKRVKGRMSFFKRLSWQKGSPIADHEDIIICTRPEPGGMTAVVSPPYANRVDDHGVDQLGYEGQTEKLGRYGSTPGQVGRLK